MTVSAPGCETEGKKVRACELCGIEETEIIPARGHTSVTLAGSAPTCTAEGLTDGVKCSFCDKVLTAQAVIPTVGHTTVADPAVAPTCTETGLTEGAHCAVCGAVLTAQAVLPARGHTSEEIPAVEPTCAAVGSTAGARCSVCGIVLEVPQELPMLEHTFHNGVCSGCGLDITSRGLLFASRGDGTCVVSGMGDCTDEWVIIPAVSPDGDVVTGLRTYGHRHGHF